MTVLPSRIPVSRLLREVVALPSIEQPVLRAGRLTLDAALGSLRRGKRLRSMSVPAHHHVPSMPQSSSHSSISLNLNALRDTADVSVPRGGLQMKWTRRGAPRKLASVSPWGTVQGKTQGKISPNPRNSDQEQMRKPHVGCQGRPGRIACHSHNQAVSLASSITLPLAELLESSF